VLQRSFDETVKQAMVEGLASRRVGADGTLAKARHTTDCDASVVERDTGWRRRPG